MARPSRCTRSRIYRATGEADALSRATELFELIDTRAHDAESGGYFEVFEPDWSPAGEGVTHRGSGGCEADEHPPAPARGFRGVLPRQPVGEGPRAAARAHRHTGQCRRPQLTACTDEYRRDWTPILEGTGALVSYGHDIENIWLLADAVQTVGHSNAPWLDLYRRLFDYSKRHGYDTAHGGFFYRGPFHENARERQKIWWVQAEGLMSALTMYRLTREPEYAEMFEATLRWVSTRQTDWTNGEWFAEVRPDGSTAGVKGDRWKEGYHNGRALIESIRLIGEL